MRFIYFHFILFSVFYTTGSMAQTKITLDDIFTKHTFRENRVRGFNFLKDGRSYTITKDNQILKFDITTGNQIETVFDAKDFDELRWFTQYKYSQDEKRILVAKNIKKNYRRSYYGDYFIYDIDERKLIRVDESSKVRDPLLSPNGQMVAYSIDNNLYIRDLESGVRQQITYDGEVNKIINGTADWVYEEEFSITRLFEWSNDSKYIAWIKSDESQVKEFSMTLYHDDEYPEYRTFKYPKVGEKNSIVSLHLYDIKLGETKNIELGEETDIYLPRLQWTQIDDLLSITRLNRHQNHIELLLVDAQSGSIKTLLNEENKYYIDLHDHLIFLEDKEHFIWTSEKDGFNHIYLYEMTGKEISQITTGDYDVTKFYGLDKVNGKVYFQAAKESPLQRETYVVDIYNKKTQKLSTQSGWNSAQFSGNYDYYIHEFSTANSPTVFTVKSRSGEVVRTIEDNKELNEVLTTFGFAQKEFFQFPNVDGTQLNGWMLKPHDFDENKTYPLFMTQYGGPGSQMVVDRWGNERDFWYQLLVQEGFVVVCVDNRGTGARGEEFKKQTYMRLGELETIDQIAAARYFANKPFIDKERIGIFGWSFGGYMSTNAILHGNDIFSLAIAVAPVTNWKWYDSVYTERFMRTYKENEEGYKSYSPVYFADRLKGDYLIIHGLADDNVHFQNSAEMVNALIVAGKEFETMYYPNRNHGIYGGGASLHIYNKMTNFIKSNL